MGWIFLVGMLGVGGAAWADDVAPEGDADACTLGRVLLMLPDGRSLCVYTTSTAAGMLPPAPACPTTVVGPAVRWEDGWGPTWRRADAHTALPYGHTVAGFVALAPGLDRAGRYDGQALTVWLDGMPLMSPTDVDRAPRLSTRLR